MATRGRGDLSPRQEMDFLTTPALSNSRESEQEKPWPGVNRNKSHLERQQSHPSLRSSWAGETPSLVLGSLPRWKLCAGWGGRTEGWGGGHPSSLPAQSLQPPNQRTNFGFLGFGGRAYLLQTWTSHPKQAFSKGLSGLRRNSLLPASRATELLDPEGI